MQSSITTRLNTDSSPITRVNKSKRLNVQYVCSRGVKVVDIHNLYVDVIGCRSHNLVTRKSFGFGTTRREDIDWSGRRRLQGREMDLKGGPDREDC